MSRYAILKQGDNRPRVPLTCHWRDFLTTERQGRLLAVDTETTGLYAWVPDFHMVTLGLADDTGCMAVDWRSTSDDERQEILAHLKTRRLVAHNAYFDGAVLERQSPGGWTWAGCSLALFRQLATEGWAGQRWGLETAEKDILGWPESNKAPIEAVLAARGLTKGDLSQLEHEVLGPYCAADADAHWQLWHALQEAAGGRFVHVLSHHTNLIMPQIRLQIESLFNGIAMDTDQLEAAQTLLLSDTAAAKAAFFAHPSVASYVAAEPPKTTPKGNLTSRWKAWHKAQQQGRALELNLNSKAQLVDLFFRHLGKKSVLQTKGKSPRPSLAKEVLPALGEEGRLLLRYNKLVKRQGYLTKVFSETAKGVGIVHPSFSPIGTNTLRPSGGGKGGLNMLQMPKNIDFLACFAARPGHKIVQLDFEALEPTILAMFSRDKTLLSIYGEGALPNQDVYLAVAARIPALGAEIVKHYNPDAPTAEGLAAAKKLCARERGIAKTVHLASVYGAGPPKIHTTLTLGGIDITLREVRGIHRDYWRLFAGVKLFEARLLKMWENSGGWIPSINGTPICVDAKFTKDIVNRFAQTSGSVVLQTLVKHIDQLRIQRKVPMKPWLCNFYDESMFEVPESFAHDAADIMIEALRLTNLELKVPFPFKGDPMIVDSLAEVKCKEAYPAWIAEKFASPKAS